MSEQNKPASNFIYMDYPPKRRRGRPRKEDNLDQMEIGQSPQRPPSNVLKNSQYFEVDPSDDIAGEMVGQVVTGIIEGSFEAGYFISVRATKTGTVLRGVVFQPGKFTPVTAANDIAPNVRMYKRREFSIPDLNPQPEKNNNQITSYSVPLADDLPRTATGTLVVGRSTNSRQNFKFGLAKKSISPQLSTDSFQSKNSSASVENENMLQQKSDISHQPRSSTIPRTNSLPKDSSGASAGGRNMTFPLPRLSVTVWGKELQRINSKFAVDNKPTSQSRSDTAFPLPTDMLRENNLSRQNSDSGLQKQSTSKSQFRTPFPLARSFSTVTLPLTDSLSKKNECVSVGGKEVPRQNLKLSLDNKPIPRWKSGMPSATDKVLMTDNLPKNDLASSSVDKENPQQNSEFFALEKPDIAFALGKSASIIEIPTEKLKENYGFGLGDVTTPRLDNKISEENGIERKKTGQQNYGFGLGDVTTPRLDNRISKENGIERKKTGQQNYGFGLGDVTTPRWDERRIPKQNSIDRNKDGARDTSSELTLGILPEKLISSNNDTPDELPWYECYGDREPVTEAVDLTAGVSQFVPKELVKMKEGITSDSELKNTGGSFQLFP